MVVFHRVLADWAGDDGVLRGWTLRSPFLKEGNDGG